MNNIEIFKNDEFGEVRTIILNEKIYFVGSDIAKSLGYARPREAISRHCKGALKQGIPTNGGNQEMSVVPEGDIYRLIVGSKLPNAEKFESWVFDEVLPSIRHNGAYMTDYALEQAVSNPDFMIGLLTNLKEEQKQRKLLQEENQKLVIKIEEDKPKIEYIDTILNSKNTMSITQIAKDYDLSGMKLNKILHSEGIQYKCGEQWLLYAKYVGNGYTKSSTFVDNSGGARVNTKWSQKGRLMIHELLTKLGYIAIIDRI